MEGMGELEKARAIEELDFIKKKIEEGKISGLAVFEVATNGETNLFSQVSGRSAIPMLGAIELLKSKMLRDMG